MAIVSLAILMSISPYPLMSLHLGSLGIEGSTAIFLYIMPQLDAYPTPFGQLGSPDPRRPWATLTVSTYPDMQCSLVVIHEAARSSVLRLYEEVSPLLVYRSYMFSL